MRPLFVDLRERILASYDKDEGTRAEIAQRFRVSLGMIKKLLQQRRRTGDIAARYRFCGRKPMIGENHRKQMQALLAKKNDLTLMELRTATGLNCSLQAINVVLGKLGLTYQKRHSGPASRNVRTLPGRADSGASGRRVSTRLG